MNKSNQFSKILITILIIIITVLGYLLSNSTETPTKIDEYQSKIDSLSSIIEYNKLKIDSLEADRIQYQVTIDNMKTKLSTLKEESIRIKNNYNEEISRIDNMSHSELVREFTNTFK